MSAASTAARLHLLTWKPALGWSWGILAASFAVNLVIQAAIPAESRGSSWTGGLLSIYAVVGVWSFGMVAQVLPFALGLGLTRRDFALGSAAVAVAQAVVFGAALTVGAAVERASGGFGVSLEFFRPAGVRQDGLLLQGLVYVAGFLLVTALLVAVAVVHHRWRSPGLLTVAAVATVVVGLAVAGVTWRGGWDEVLDSVTGVAPVVGLVLVPLALTALLSAAGWAGLRRATV